MTVRCLTQKQKEDLYDDWASESYTNQELADKYAVSKSTVRRAVLEIEEWDHEWVDDALIDNDVTYSFIMTPDSISITKIEGDDVDTVNVDEEHEKFQEVYNTIILNPRDQKSLEQAFETLNIKTRIENITEGKVTVIPEENRVVYNNGGATGSFSGKLVSRILEAVQNGEGVDHLLKFADRLLENPSYRAVHELYEFLQAADIKITEDGMVQCFKRVRGDYKDVHSGTFDNSPGQRVSVPRNMVDENSNNTCSYGLHVCSHSYLNSYGGERVIEVHVDPKDFVSIPADYYSTGFGGYVKAKARVCAYNVIRDITDEYHSMAAEPYTF